MIKKIILNISYIAFFSALTFICTYFVLIPFPNGLGYFNLSDAIVIFSSILFGPIIGVFSGIIGAGIGDFISGYVSCLPFTILAKGLEGIVAFLLFKLLFNKKIKYISFFIAIIPMVLIYFIYYLIITDFSLLSSLTSSSFDLIQGICGGSVAIVFYFLFNKADIKNKYNYLNITKIKDNK